MGEQVLSDEQRDAIRREAITTTEYDQIDALITLTGRATIAALAARSIVDVDELTLHSIDIVADHVRATDSGFAISKNAVAKLAGALRLALATAEAQHAEREAKSLSPMDRVQAAISALNALEGVPIRFNAHDSIRGVVGALREAKDELRCALGLEGA